MFNNREIVRQRKITIREKYINVMDHYVIIKNNIYKAF